MINDSFPKPRPDAKLKTLPEPRQAQIAEFARTHSLANTVRWLADAGFKTSSSALSQFLRWWRLKQDLARSQSALQDKLADVVRRDSSPTVDRLRQAGHALFAISAIQNQDPRAWHLCQADVLREKRH
jgi:hypothetical protein